MDTNTPTPTAIDVTGLPPEAVRAVEDMVQRFRSPTGVAHPNLAPGGPPLDLTPEERVARFNAWLATIPPAPGPIDDSRESIYGDDE